MWEITYIICYLTLAIIFFINYLRDEKLYWLLVTMVMVINIFFKTPFASVINKTSENILMVIELLLGFVALYLLGKEYREKKK